MVVLRDLGVRGRNLGIYTIGVGLAIVGALGLVDVLDLSTSVAMLVFSIGIGLVLLVHEYFDGPF
ncbi:hypothetical protein ACLI4U_03120 [Natrialbaceae archaeon A-CW2]|uniref:hypothetical protein n=1 Tax=Natronosalvus amylolyticus TaxID=2961994 RepID=UPI0020C9D430|nr:hypothetical protein [Natronosalvus amylolyticus]